MTVVIDGTEYLPVSAAAQQLATTELKVLMLLRQKALEGEMIEGKWFVTTDSLNGFDPSAAKPASQPHCSTGCGGSGCGRH